jgi:hypothetical protein
MIQPARRINNQVHGDIRCAVAGNPRRQRVTDAIPVA